MEIVSWQPVLTDHQSHTLEALQRATNCELTVYVSKAEDATRNAQGWVSRHASSLSPHVLQRHGWLRDVIHRICQQRDAVHLFGSPFDQPRLIVALLCAVALRRRVFLISEPYSPIRVGYLQDEHRLIDWVKGTLRPLVYRCYGVLLRRRLAGVFAISPLAESQYREMGIPAERIFPFGYFIPKADVPSLASDGVVHPRDRRLRVIFVGALIARKGLDLLIEAVRTLHREGARITLDVFGPGETRLYDFDQTVIRYCGLIPFGTAQAIIADYDVLVLPSRYDGWGVVVNEALLAGVPVVCSDRVGAGAVVRAWGCGLTFASEDVADLKVKLSDLALHPDRLARVSAAAKEAGMSLDPEVAGRFMFDVISGNSGNAAPGLLCPTASPGGTISSE